jgi:hypothetical protein
LALKTRSLLQNSTRTKNTNTLINKSKVETGRPKHGKNKAIENPGLKIFIRGPGQWSFKGSKSKINKNENKSVNEQSKPQSQTSKATFQRSWSLRKPSYTSENIQSSVQAVPLPSQSRTNETLLGMNTRSERNNKQTTPMKKYSSQNDLNVQSKKRTQFHTTRMTPTVSTSSIPSVVGCIKYLERKY